MIKSFLLMVLAIVLVTVATIPVFIFNTIRKAYRKENLSEYFLDVAIGFDQAGGSIIYSEEDWTVSSYTHYLCEYRNNKSACFFEKFIDLLFGKKHCINSYKTEQQEFKEIHKTHNTLDKA